jgi:gamma-glutamyltranspeptidase/glutathione hydrolase
MKLQTYPFPSQRMPLLATNGAVATSHPLAAQAGLTMLQRGGNAIDAAIAAAAALIVVEPTSNGLGSDTFALVWDGARLHGLNGSGRAPAALPPAAELRGQGHVDMPPDGWLPVTTPGTVAAWADLHQRFARLPLADLLAPAIAYADDGFGVTPVVAHAWQKAAGRFLPQTDPAVSGWANTFAPGGRAPQAGERWACPDQARTLRRLAQAGPRDFYQGRLAQKIAEFSRATGGYLFGDDLTAHHSQWVPPISVDYRGYTVWEIPPNGQGLTALLALAMLAGFDLPAYPHGSVESLHRQIEAMKLAFADAYRYIADPEHADVPAAGLLSPEYVAARRSLIGPQAGDPGPGDPPRGGTVYLCTADRAGLMVSFIQSNYMGFGSGVVVPGTGIALNNRGACFSLEPGHSNEAAPGKRPYHTIIPGFLTRGDQAVGPFGVMGGFMQPQGHVQVITGMVDYGLNPQAVLDTPRWQVTGGRAVELEIGAPEHVLHALESRGHRVRLSFERSNFGRGQIIWRLPQGVLAAGSDPRADGAAVGW